MQVGGNGNGRNVEPECANGEECENGFGEHGDEECRKREQMTMAPGLELEKGTGESCTAAEEIRERTSNLLYISGNRWVQVRIRCVVEFQLRYHWHISLSVQSAEEFIHAIENQITA